MLTGKQFGRYTVGAKIGEGGMGEVYAANDDELGRSVAIKLLPSEFQSDDDRRRRFRQEARAASGLNHPNIITIYEIGESEHGSFLATELIDGRTLRDVIRSESLSLPAVLRIVEQTANALVAAHNAKIVHRDIKPENIMLRGDSIVKVLDFGLAKPTGTSSGIDPEGNTRTMPGTVMGSARYMSPEQARGLEVDERTDIWSLGVVLYELLTRTAPFDGETTADTIAAVIHKDPAPVADVMPNVPTELLRILRKALQKDRDERYQSVKDFALDIKDLLYEIEHAGSGARKAHVTSSPDLSENPTIKHKTVSANHPTSTYYDGPIATAYSTADGKKRRLPAIGLSAVVAILIALMGFGYYKWFVPRDSLVTNAFERTQTSRVNTDGKVVLPAISGDGKYLAYVSGDIGNHSLVVRQISTDSTVTIVPASNLNFSALTFSPSGDRVYYCQTRSDFSINTLYQVPTLGGASKKLIDDVDSAVTFSPDEKQFAFMRHVSKTNEDYIFVVNAATLEATEIMRSRQSGYDFFSARMAWSPDGKRILIGAGKRQSGSISEMVIGEIWLADRSFKTIDSGRFYTVSNFTWFADGSGFLCAGRETQTSPIQIWRSSYPDIDLHQVTNDFNDYGEVGLSADGRTILTLKGDTSSALWKYSPATGDAVQITSDGRNAEGTLGLGQLADGRMLYTRIEAKKIDLWTADANGKNSRPLVTEPGSAVSPVVTPDGRYIIFNLQKPKSSRIWRVDADGKNPVQLTEENPDQSDFSPQLTADGSTIVFQRQITNDDKTILMKVPVQGGPTSVFYASETHGAFSPRFSPDGKRVAFVTYDVATFEKRLKIATVDGSGPGKVEADLEFNLKYQFVWAPDSKSLTVLTSRDGPPNVWRQPLSDSAATPITDFKTSRIFNFAWTSDGKELLLARGTVVNDLILIRDARDQSDRKTIARAESREPAPAL